MAILMTGVTGVLGSEVGPALVRKEDIFFLVRKNSINKVPNGMNIDKAIIGDITLPMCGISSQDMDKLKRASVVKLLHLAADVSFSPVDKDGKIRLTNFNGTKNVLDLALKLGVEEFHKCGTAYASSRRNPYEISKDDSEKLTMEFCREHDIKFSIYKPSAIVGNYKTGASSGFNGFIGASKVFYIIAQGIRRKEGCIIINLPIYFVCSSHSTMNLIPADWVSRTLIKLYKLGAKNEVYNLTHHNPPLARWVIEQGLKNLDIIGINYVEEPLSLEQKEKLIGSDSSLLRRQKRLDMVLDQFHPYCLSERKFSLDTTIKALGDDFESPPPIDLEFIFRLFEYAREVNFRSNERKQKDPVPIFEIQEQSFTNALV